jgi:hypothetical protein
MLFRFLLFPFAPITSSLISSITSFIKTREENLSKDLSNITLASQNVDNTQASSSHDTITTPLPNLPKNLNDAIDKKSFSLEDWLDLASFLGLQGVSEYYQSEGKKFENDPDNESENGDFDESEEDHDDVTVLFSEGDIPDDSDDDELIDIIENEESLQKVIESMLDSHL